VIVLQTDDGNILSLLARKPTVKISIFTADISPPAEFRVGGENESVIVHD
jgi:hypothetical protein